MSIWNKVLAGLIIVALLVFFGLTARTFRAHTVWRTALEKREKERDQVAKDQQTVIDGDAARGTPGIRKLEVDLQRLIARRGRVWKNVAHAIAEAGTGKVRVTPQQLSAQALNYLVGTQVFVFRQAEEKDPGAYLGSFKVGAVTETDMELQPIHPTMLWYLSGRLRESKGPWTIYEKMPGPNPEFLAEVPGGPAGAGPAAKEAANKEADKDAKDAKSAVARLAGRLIDYQKLFDDFYSWHARMTDTITALKNMNAAMEKSIELTKAEEGKLQEDKRAFAAEEKEAARRESAVTAHLEAVKTKIKQADAAIDAARKANGIYAAQIAQLQSEATRRLDQQAPEMGPERSTY